MTNKTISEQLKQSGIDTAAHPLDDAIRQLVQTRNRLGWSQLVAEEKIGCSEGLLPKWESGKRRPSLTWLLMWARALGYDVFLDSSVVLNGGQPANDLRNALALLESGGVSVALKPRPVSFQKLQDGGAKAVESLRRTAEAADQLNAILSHVAAVFRNGSPST